MSLSRLHPYAEHPLKLEIAWERHRLFMQEVGSRMVATAIAGGLIGLLFYPSASAQVLAIWFALLAFVSLNSFFILRRYRFADEATASSRNVLVRRWQWLNLYLAFIWGVAWGSAPLLFFPDANATQMFTLLLLTVIVASTPSMLMGVYPDIYIAYLTPLFAAYTYAFWGVELGEGWLHHWLAPITWSSLVLFSLMVHRTQIGHIVLSLEHKHAREEAARASNEKSRFLATASHDLRQPLQAAALYADALHREGAHSPLLDKLRMSLGGANELLDRLLDISRLESGAVAISPSLFDLSVLLRDVADLFAISAREKGLTLRVEVPCLLVETDQVLLAQLLKNLVANAVRYTDEGEVLLQASAEGKRVHVAIIDSGIGIPQAQQEAVFEEFVQLHNAQRSSGQGLGLGLPIVKRIAERLGLTWQLRSRPGEGTRFELELPLVDRPLPKAEVPMAVHGNAQEDGPCILLVDDEPSIRDALSILLVQWGCDVWSAASLDEALALLAEGVCRPQWLLTDDRLGNGVDGPMVIEAVTAATEAPPQALIITGNTAPERLRELQQSGYPVMHKPIDQRALQEQLFSMN